MKNIIKSRKALNFDLDNHLLKEYYPSKNYKGGWKDIQIYLKRNGFLHRQYSGYVSYDYIEMNEVIQIITEMSVLLIWLKKCLKEFDVTIVGDEYSLIDYIHQDTVLN